MDIDIVSLVLGLLAGSIIAVAFAVPRVGRIIAGIISIILMGGGAGFLIWAITSLSGIDEFRPIGSYDFNVSTPAEALGIGGGLLAGGVAALVLCLTMRPSKR